MGDSATSSTRTSRRRENVMRRQVSELGDAGEGSARVCYCGMVAPLCTSWTEQNPGRRFYGCRNYQHGMGCGFFQWHDEEVSQRSKEVINELLGIVDKRNKQRSASDVNKNIDALYLDMKKKETRFRMAFGALIMSWIFFFVVMVL